MAIPLPENQVVTIPPKPEVVADKLWCTQLIIRTPSPTDQNSLLLEYQPWSGGADSPIARDGSGNDTTRQISLADIFTVAAYVPEMGAAMSAILAAIPALLEYHANPEKYKEEHPIQ